MDFEVSDWTVDSNVLQLDKQLFAPKNQLTVLPSRKERKRKLQDGVVNKPKKSKDEMKIDKNITKLADRKKLKKERRKEKLKQLKTEIGNEKVEKRKISECEKTKIQHIDKKYNKHLTESSQSGNATQKKKKKEKLMEDEDLTSDVNDKSLTKGVVEDETNTKKKRRKKKKSSSKKNKYKHLDEERLAAKIKIEHSLSDMAQAKKSIHENEDKLAGKSNSKLKNNTTDSKYKNDSPIVPSKRKKVKKVKKLTETKVVKTSQVEENEVVEASVSKTENLSDFQTYKIKGTEPQKDFKTKSKQKTPFKIATLQKVLLDTRNTVQKETGNVDKTTTEGKKGDNSVNVESKRKEKQKPVSLRDRMIEQLKSARFRYINEQLYTQTGSEAAKLFADDQESFHCYHEGFQNQVEKWPTNPVDVIIKQIKAGPSSAVVGDFGCGDAKIARSVPNKVHSFDLVALNNHITVCNIEKVPLKNGSLDIAVFCLSLMGTNLTDYLKEANRVLKKGGMLIIAEVTSRIEKVGKFIKSIERMGFQLNNKDSSNAMFILMDFKKIGITGEDLPEIKLDPCVYKKR